MKVRKELFDEKCFLEFFEQLNKEKGFPDYFHVDWISFVFPKSLISLNIQVEFARNVILHSSSEL